MIASALLFLAASFVATRMLKGWRARRIEERLAADRIYQAELRRDGRFL
jgi:hypothetical protein